MTIQYLVLAKNDEHDLSPMARLALIAIGDSYAWTGPHFDVFDRVQEWTRQGVGNTYEGLYEMLAAGLVFVDRQHVDKHGRPANWLSFVPGWENEWEDLLWQRFPVTRPPIPKALRDAVFERDGHRCRVCGTPERLAVDHVHPVSRGGLTVLHNLQTLCRRHNSIKSAKLPAGVTR